MKPEEILQHYPWLQDMNREMIIHNDLDGILTGMFLSHYLDWKVVGVFDLSNLYISDDYTGKLKDLVYADLDVTYKNFMSIGHHIIGEEDINHLNVNNLFRTKFYAGKYPFSTVMFLYFLYKMPLPKSEEALSFLLQADSVYQNYIKYERNSKNWIKKLNRPDFSQCFTQENCPEIILNTAIKHTYGKSNQSFYSVVKGEAMFPKERIQVNDYISFLCNTFEFTKMQIPNNLNRIKKFDRQQVILEDKTLEEELKTLRKVQEVFSYSLKNKNLLDICLLN